MSNLTDLPRIRSLFENLDNLPPKMNPSVKRAFMDLKHNLRSSGEIKKSDPFRVTVYFCALSAGFTDSAEAEFDKMNTQPIPYGDIDIDLTFFQYSWGISWKQNGGNQTQDGETKITKKEKNLILIFAVL